MSRALPPLAYVLARHATLPRSGLAGSDAVVGGGGLGYIVCGGAYPASVMSYVGLMIATAWRSWSDM